LEGVVHVVNETTTGRRKKVYGVTQLGIQQLDAWLTQKPEESVMRNELLMKIFVSDEGHIPQLAAYVEEELEACKELTEILAGIKLSLNNMEGKQEQLWLLTLDYGERYLQMTIEWCQHALEIF